MHGMNVSVNISIIFESVIFCMSLALNAGKSYIPESGRQYFECTQKDEIENAYNTQFLARENCEFGSRSCNTPTLNRGSSIRVV